MFDKQKGFPLLPQVTTVGENIISANNNFTGNNTFAGDTTFTGSVKDDNGNDFVTEVDYATKNNAGVVQIGDGISVDENGVISSTEVTVDGQVVSTFDADTKANVDGFYEGMTVGHALEADQLASDREIENADEACPPITFGPIGGTAEVQDGYSKFEELRGNTICWKQLFVPRSTVTTGGVTVTNNGDGSFTLSDTATGEVYLDITDSQYPISYIKGHKYLLRGGITTDAELSASSSSITGSWAGNTPIIFTANSGTDSGYVRVRIVNGTTYNNVKIIPQLFDLTQMFGAGNEPTTIEEFTSQFPAPYYAHNAGQLLSSKSASMILRGINQLNLNRTAGTLSGWGNTTPRAFEESKYYAGLTIDGYYEASRISNITITDSSVSFSTSTNGYGIGFPVRVISGQDYILEVADYLVGIGWYDKGGNYLSYSSAVPPSNIAIGTAPINAYWGVVVLRPVAGETVYTYTEIQFRLYYDTPNLPYSAYDQQVVTLPNLELKSARSAYDVAYQTGGGKRRIGRVDLGTLNWQIYQNILFYANVPNGVDMVGAGNPANFITTKYDDRPTASAGTGAAAGPDLTAYWDATNAQILIKDTNYSDPQAFATAVSGEYLCYELKTETDITIEENPGWTELVKIDNFGTIEFTVDPDQNPQVPQAYFIRYTVNLGEWVDSAYVKTNGDPNNIITNTDYATKTKAGIGKVDPDYGIEMRNGEMFAVNPAVLSEIKAGTSSRKPVACARLDQSVFYALAKAAGANLAASTSETAPDGTNTGVYPANAIQAILKMILPTAPTTDGTYDLVCTVSSGTPTFSWVART